MKNNSPSLAELIVQARSAREQARRSMEQAKTAQTGWDRLIVGLQTGILPPLRRAVAALHAEIRAQALAWSNLLAILNRRVRALQRLPSQLNTDLHVVRWRILIPILYLYAEVRDFIRRFWRVILAAAGMVLIIVLLIMILPLIVNWFNEMLTLMFPTEP